jgi:GTPase
VFLISSHSKEGVKKLFSQLKKLVKQERQRLSNIEDEESEGLPVITLRSESSWHIEKKDSGYLVKGNKIERFARRTDFEDDHGVERIKDIMRKMGITRGLNKHNIKPGDKVWIGDEGPIEFCSLVFDLAPLNSRGVLLNKA